MGKKAQQRRHVRVAAKMASRPAGAAAGPASQPASGTAVHVSDASFDRDVLRHDKPVLVDFWAPWCGPCKAVAPILDELAKEYDGKLRVAKLNTEQNRRVPMAYNIRSIPTMILFKDGEVADVKIGAAPKAALQRWLDRQIADKPAGLLSRLLG